MNFLAVHPKNSYLAIFLFIPIGYFQEYLTLHKTLPSLSPLDLTIFNSVVSESTFWRVEPSRVFSLASRAELYNFQNRVKTTLKNFDTSNLFLRNFQWQYWGGPWISCLLTNWDPTKVKTIFSHNVITKAFIGTSTM